jgi:NADH:ubiquinone oxidoreductase subunit 6 (subunit J)
MILMLLVGVVMATVTPWGRGDLPIWSVPGIVIYVVAVVVFFRLALYVLGELEWWRTRRREFLIAR